MSLGLIIDRTQADVDLVTSIARKIIAGTASASELSAWAAGLKGAYNAADLNRVGNACDTVAAYFNAMETTLAAYLAALGVAPDALYDLPFSGPISVTTKTDWQGGTTPDIPTVTQMQQYLANISTLRAVIALPSGTPSVPADMNGLTYQEANAIEQILETVYAAAEELLDRLKGYADRAAASWVYSGQPYSGLVNSQLGG